ncbi:VOC family protein [soil metagenome]
MTMTVLLEPPRVYPTFRYRDAAKMIEWLKEAFGFTTHVVYADDSGVIQHAQLALGSSMIMVGTVRDDAYGKMVGAPGENAGKSVYVAIDDTDALFVRVKAAGAEILEGLTDRDYGSREFICRDPEGNVWSFGTYWPKAHEPAP